MMPGKRRRLGPLAAQQTEAQLQAQVVQLLGFKGLTVWEMFKGTERGGRVFCTKGIPDLYVFGLKNGQPLAFWLELKTPTGKLSEAQKERHTELRAAGQPVYVPRSLEDVLEILSGYGLHRTPAQLHDDLTAAPEPALE